MIILNMMQAAYSYRQNTTATANSKAALTTDGGLVSFSMSITVLQRCQKYSESHSLAGTGVNPLNGTLQETMEVSYN